MEPTDLTIEILKGIREECRKTNERVDETNERVDKLSDSVSEHVQGLRADFADGMERVARRVTETEVRLATEIVAVGGTVREVRDLLRADVALRHRVDDHERRLAAVESRQR